MRMRKPLALAASSAASSAAPTMPSPPTTTTTTTMTVHQPPRRFPPNAAADGGSGRPAHHLDDTRTKFGNPWPSFRFQEPAQWVSMIYNNAVHSTPVPPDVKSAIPTQVPTWGHAPGTLHAAKATWLGHACYLVELPAPPGAARGPRLIFDPVFSRRCSPSQLLGPARYTDPPCKVEDVPPVDLIVLSHNHYDHTDIPTLRALLAQPLAQSSSPASASPSSPPSSTPSSTPSPPDRTRTRPHIFVPLNNAAALRSALALPRTSSNPRGGSRAPDPGQEQEQEQEQERVHELDWWDERVVRIALPALPSPTTTTTTTTNNDKDHASPPPPPTPPTPTPTVEAQLRITCAPSQHTSGRTGLDRWAALWAAWVVEELLPPSARSAPAAAAPSSATDSAAPSAAGAGAATSPGAGAAGAGAVDAVDAVDAAADADALWTDVGRKLYFAGDTGYRTVRPARSSGASGKEAEGASEEARMEALERAAPCCPAFREVGERFGGVDVALVPIGAYAPRAMWSNLHASPADAVRIMQDVRARRALAMHWGTWVLTTEPVLEPPALLRRECEKAGVGADEFLVPALGETVLF